jgi:hypothetical protein
MKAATVIPLLLCANELDRLAADYERAAAVSLVGGGQRDWPQTVHDLVSVAYCLRFVARHLREKQR